MNHSLCPECDLPISLCNLCVEEAWQHEGLTKKEKHELANEHRDNIKKFAASQVKSALDEIRGNFDVDRWDDPTVKQLCRAVHIRCDELTAKYGG